MRQSPEELLRVAEARAQSLLEFRMAEVGRLAMERFLTERIIELGLASNAEEAGNVRIEDVLNAERERAG